jgi:hypothetical protein
MAGNNRMTGQQAPDCCTKHTFPASVAVAVGDLLYRDPTTFKVKPMSSFTWDTNIATTQLASAKYFAGLSNERRLSTETDSPEGMVYDAGEAMLSCSALGSAQFAGDLVGVAENSSALSATNVAIVTDRALAIGCLSRPAVAGATQVYVRFQANISRPLAFEAQDVLNRNEINTALTTVGAGSPTAASIIGGVITRTGPTAAFTDTTPTAAAIIAALPADSQVGQSWELTYKNTVAFTGTLAAGSGVTLSGVTILPPNSVGRFLVTYATATTVTIVGLGVGPMTTGPLLVNTPDTTVGAATLTAAGIVGGVITRSGAVAAYTDTTETATNIIAAKPNANIGDSWILQIKNTVAFAETLAGGTGVTVSGITIVPPLSVGEFLVTYTAASTVTVVGIGNAPLCTLPASQYSTAAGQSTTLTGAQVAGAWNVCYDNTGTTPANLQMPTAANIVAAIPNAQVGMTYMLEIRNSSGSANTATITTNTGITLTGTMTIAQTVTRRFCVTVVSLTAVTVQSMGISAAGA